MAFDGNGNWVSDYYPESGERILASEFNDTFIADLEHSFENCVTRDGQGKFLANVNANNYRVINVSDPIGNKDAVNKQTMETKINTLLSSLYPVGSIYIGTQSTCPLATLISGSTWTLVAQNRALWGGDGTNGNTTINAGLPNITGTFGGAAYTKYSGGYSWTGAFKNEGDPHYIGHDGAYGQFRNTTFDASLSNSIYGASSTVQPPAYRVNVWRRTA